MSVTVSLADPYVAEFQSFARAIGDAEPSWLRSLRKEAVGAFQKVGFPGVKDEDWKHTNVAPVVRTPFRYEPQAEPPRIPGDLVEAYTFGVLKCSQLVFVNGHFAPKLSYLRWLPEGVRIRSLQEVIHFDPKAVEPHLGKFASFERQPFTALNTAFLQDGAFVHVPEGRIVEEPIHLLYVSTSVDPAAVSYPRNLILLDDRSQATVIESYVGLDKGAYFTNAVTEFRVGKGAVLDHYKMQRESEAAYHFSSTGLVQARSSAVASTSLNLGGGLVRNDVNTRFADEGGSLALNGLYLLHDAQHCENHTFIDHARPNCTSLELFKGILDARSRGIFYGKILVRKDAQKTNARQTNKNLLLSNDAFADSTPGLEILADDVKCSHGSTVGQLDENAVFYLRSRGIDESSARTLLTYAFAGEIINQVKVASMRIKLDQLILSRLPGSDVIQEAL
ncbi:MAG TPA: Fe-S cluster assembly protein SufD [Thermoplasmata archaeon]|nr:Fe-S cluster assembly protein SufD [Thermoplasmata archaeon]